MMNNNKIFLIKRFWKKHKYQSIVVNLETVKNHHTRRQFSAQTSYDKRIEIEETS